MRRHESKHAQETGSARRTAGAATLVDRSAESEFTIQPDGRVHLFGITRPALEVLASLPNQDPGMRTRLKRMLVPGSAPDAVRADEPSEELR
jgi:hypothetical protein